jgi:glycine C-acetyltransferase
MQNTLNQIQQELTELQNQFLFKQEHFIENAQGVEIQVQGRKLLNFCANNYLGLSSHPDIIESAKKAMDDYGFGLSSVRFICGTQTLHKILEQKIAQFLGAEDAILYAAAFDANGGLFEPLFHENDAIISDQLNHASIIDGIRLSKAMRYRYQNNDMLDLEKQIIAAKNKGARRIVIATDGVFSMDGLFANLPKIIELAHQYECHWFYWSNRSRHRPSDRSFWKN